MCKNFFMILYHFLVYCIVSVMLVEIKFQWFMDHEKKSIVIHYCLILTGPSYSVDTACSSGFMALHNAIQDIRRGDCDAAIVGASNLLMKPHTSLQFLRLGALSPDGQSKCFDSSGKWSRCTFESTLKIPVIWCSLTFFLFCTRQRLAESQKGVDFI